MERSSAYFVNGNGEKLSVINGVKSHINLKETLENYLYLQDQQKQTKKNLSRLENEIANVEQMFNRALSPDVGTLITINDRLFCCVHSSLKPIVIEMEEE